jgi:hypothetical protein
MSSVASISNSAGGGGSSGFFGAVGQIEGYFAAAVPVGVETTVFTKLIPGTGRYGILQVNFSGRGPALFRLKVDGVTVDYGQIVWTKRADEHTYPNGSVVAAGSTVTITVFSYDSMATDFFGSISGVQE